MLKLGNAGYDEDRLEELGRAELLETLAETIIAQSETEQADLAREAQEASKVLLPAGDSSSVASEGGSDVLRLRELELEEKRDERKERRAEREREDRRALLELEERKAAREAEMSKVTLEAEAEARKAALEAEAKKAALESEARRLEAEERRADREAKMQLEQAKLAHKIPVLELKAQQTQLGKDVGYDSATPSEPRGKGNLALQTKRFGEMIRKVLPKMPAESAELPQFFETIE